MPAFSRALAVASEIVVPIPDGDPRLRIPVSTSASALHSPNGKQHHPARSPPLPLPSSTSAAAVSNAAAALTAAFVSSPLNSGADGGGGERFNFEALSENDSLQFLNVRALNHGIYATVLVKFYTHHSLAFIRLACVVHLINVTKHRPLNSCLRRRRRRLQLAARECPRLAAALPLLPLSLPRHHPRQCHHRRRPLLHR